MLSARFHRDLIEQVINRIGCREKRKRLLPTHVMIRYVTVMDLYGQESAEEVMRRLVGSLRAMGSFGDDWWVPTGSAVTQARNVLVWVRSGKCSTGPRCRWPGRARRARGWLDAV